MSEDKKNFVNLDAIGKADESKTKVYEEIAKVGHCPFCGENLLKYNKTPVIKETKHWIMFDNQWPYEKVKHQILAVHKVHIEHISELSPEAGAELIELFGQEAKKRNMPGGGIAMRFGSNPGKGNYGNSVLHLHAHLFEPDLEALEETESWRFKFGQPKN